jgi:hypothetical protein
MDNSALAAQLARAEAVIAAAMRAAVYPRDTNDVVRRELAGYTPVLGDDAYEYVSAIGSDDHGDDWDEVFDQTLDAAKRGVREWLRENESTDEGTSLVIRRRIPASAWETIIRAKTAADVPD